MMAHSANNRNIPSQILICLVFVLLLPTGLRAAQPQERARIIPIRDGEVSAAAEWVVTESSTQSMNLQFSLQGLRQEIITAEGCQWQALTIEDGGISGDVGTPGLPSISRLVEIPMGSTVTASLLSRKMTDLGKINLMPVQSDEANSFTSPTSAEKNQMGFGVSVSKPAIMAGRQVVSLTVYPLDYNNKSGLASVASEMDVQLDFTGGQVSANNRPLPASFAGFFSEKVSGYKGSAGGMGTYLLISSGDSSVSSSLEPLIQWRGRQGYHVEQIFTNTTGNNTGDIKSAIQAIYDDESIPPLEFISIAGDANGDYYVSTWHESLSGYGGEGDHYYTTLDGDDILADVHIGRISFRNLTQLNLIVGKITGYEQSPPMADTDWFQRASLIGDPSSSGITTIYVNQWLKGQLFANGWTHVDTTWSGNFVGSFYSTVNPGVSAFGYRGYWEMSGINSNIIENLSNGSKLAFAILPTCGTGSFQSDITSNSEAFLRAPNGGAIAAVGTATTGTHTRYNNCYYQGVWDGMLNGGDFRSGVAHTLGKVELYNNYFQAEPDIANIWAVWNNLMGDPATRIWCGVPSNLVVQYPAQVSEHGQAVIVQAESASGEAVPGATVCLYRDNEVQVVGYTDESGQAILDLPSISSGTLQLTVAVPGFLPYMSSLTVGAADVECLVTSAQFDDDQLNPGESFELAISLTNFGTTTAAGVTGVLTAITDGTAVQQGNLSFGDINSGNEEEASSVALVSLDVAVIGGQEVQWLLTSTNGITEWTSLISSTVHAGVFTVGDLTWLGGGSNPDPGESGALSLELGNIGDITATNVSAVLTTENPWVNITNSTSSFGSINQGSTATNNVSPFAFDVNSDCYAGNLAVFHLAITSGNGYLAETEFTMVLGTANSDVPTGPDAYTYYAYDNTDIASGNAPEYDWIALDPDHGGLGTDLGLSDFGWEQDDTKTITLPFSFSYYGQDFTEISICSNGWLAMGETPLVHYRNFSIPSKGSPGNMIAPFWDNLNQTGNRRVYTYYDEANNRFIVQWYRMSNQYSGATQNFEVILNDPAEHGSGFGDGEIIFQYEEVGNTDARDGYATVGIQNADRTDGLLYTYWNQYDASASPLVSGRAIKFMPLGDVVNAVASVTPGSFEEHLAPDVEVVSYLHIVNLGEEGSRLRYNLKKVDPLTIPTEKSVIVDDDPVVDICSISGSTVTLSESEYISGSEMTMTMEVNCISSDQEWILLVDLDVPDGVSVVSASGITDQGVIAWDGQTGSGVTTSWGSTGHGEGHINDNSTGQATITLNFASDLEGSVALNWSLTGDAWGADPHHISGEIALTSQGPSVTVSSPNSGDLVTLSTNYAINFSAYNGPELLDIAIQRTAGGSWQTIAEDVTASAGTWDWVPSGEPGSYAVIKVSDAADSAVFGLSGIFGVGRNLDWLQLETTSGSLLSEQTQDVAVTLNSSQLTDGQYDATILFTSNGGQALAIPVQLVVSSTTAVGSVPTSVALHGNWPNPFNPQTVIRFSLPQVTDVSLNVYSARGQLVTQLLTGMQQPGLHQVVWDGRDSAGRVAASGVYFYRLETVEGNLTGKMTLAK